MLIEKLKPLLTSFRSLAAIASVIIGIYGPQLGLSPAQIASIVALLGSWGISTSIRPTGIATPFLGFADMLTGGQLVPMTMGQKLQLQVMSRRFIVALGGVALVVLQDYFKLPITEANMQYIVAALVAFIFGDGIKPTGGVV